jgi:hypothetical protein
LSTGSNLLKINNHIVPLCIVAEQGRQQARMADPIINNRQQPAEHGWLDCTSMYCCRTGKTAGTYGWKEAPAALAAEAIAPSAEYWVSLLPVLTTSSSLAIKAAK